MLKTDYSAVYIPNPEVCQIKDMMPVKEEYYGKSPALQEAYKALDVIVKRINSTPKLELGVLDIDSMPECKKLEQAFCKEFGFGKCLIHWDNATVPIAYTVVGGYLINQYPGMKHIGKPPKDKYYDSDHMYACCICVIMCLIRNNQFTTGETMAFILHEIGHNFDNTYSTFTLKTINFMFFGNVFSDVWQALYHSYYIKALADIQKAFPRLAELFNFYKSWMWHFMPILIFNPRWIPIHPYDYLHIIFGAEGEYFSDSFAAKYGFGPDLASGMAKIGDKSVNSGIIRRAMYSIPGIRTLYDMVEGPAMFLAIVFDEHPLDENRIIATRNNLLRDYSDPDVPKKFKPEIKKQIELVDRIIEADKKNAEENGLIFSSFRKFILYQRQTPPPWKKKLEKSVKD